MAYWAANVDAANGSVAQVIAGFSASTESGVLYAGATTAQKISSIYLALFNRNPEAAGLAYWVALDTTSWTGLTSLTTQSNNGIDVITAGAGTAVTATAVNHRDSAVLLNGGSNVSLTATGSTTGTITVGTTIAPTGTVTVSNSSSGAGNMGTITVKGGTVVKVTQLASNAVGTTTTQGSVTVTGTALTTSVEVTNTARATASGSTAGVNLNTVTISDVNASSTTQAGTITNVSVSNATTTLINTNALTNLSAKGGSGNIVIDNSGLTVATNKTLNLTLDGQTGGTLDDADIYTTLNLTTAGSNSTLANITFGALTTLNISGTQTLTLVSTAGQTALTSVKVSGSAGLTADLTNATLTSINASGASGNVTLNVNGSKASYQGGSGIDQITLTGTPTKVISGGAGTSDVLTLTVLNASLLTSATLVSGFEEVVFTGAINRTINTANFVGATQFTTSGGNGLTLSNMVSGSTLKLTGSGAAYTVSGPDFLAGSNDTLNVKLTDGFGASQSFAGGGITAANVENFVITVSDTQATPTSTFNDSVGLLGNDAKTITVSGNAGLNLTATSTALTSVDASGITMGGFIWNAGNLTSAITVKGSQTGTNGIGLTAIDNAVVNYTGGTGANTLTTGNGNDIVTLGNSAGTTTIAFGSGTDKLVLAGIATTKAAFTQTTGLGIGDSIDFSGAKGTATNSVQTALGIKLTGQTSLDDYLNAATTTSVAVGASAVLNWFQFNGKTYIVQDTSANSTFTEGADSVVSLSGTVELTGASVVAGLVSMNPA